MHIVILTFLFDSTFDHGQEQEKWYIFIELLCSEWLPLACYMERALTSSYYLFWIQSFSQIKGVDKTWWNYNTILLCAVLLTVYVDIALSHLILTVGFLRYYSKNANISFLWSWDAPLGLQRGVIDLLVGGVTDPRTPVWLTTSRRHFTCIGRGFEIIVKQQNLIMTASFPCVFIAKTPNTQESLVIKLPWRNRYGFKDIEW